jgi:hypothetical protein
MITALTGKQSIYRAKGVSSLFLSLLLATAGSFAQKKYPAEATNPTFVLYGRISLDSLTRHIHQHSVFRFSFNSRKIRGEKQITFVRGHYSLPSLLQRIRQTTGLYYRRYKEHVIFQDNQPPGWIAEKHGGGDETLRDRDERLRDRGPKGRASRNIKAAIINNAIPPIRSPKLRYPHPPLQMAGPGVTERKKHTIPWLLRAGFFTSETLYGNLQAEAGIKPIHLLVSYGTDLTRHAWQMGLGSIIHKSENNQWQLFATYSRLRNTYRLTDTFNIIGKIYQVKGSWYVAGMNFCTRMSGRWMLKAGASANLLKTSYWLDGQLSNAVNLLPLNDNPDTRYRQLQPPYYLINTFNKNNPVNYKAWIGLSLGIYYNLPL